VETELEAIGKLIRDLRDKRGWTQRELGDKVGVSPQAVSEWERGNVPPLRKHRRRLDAALRAEGQILAALNHADVDDEEDDDEFTWDKLVNLMQQLDLRLAALEAEGDDRDRRIDALESQAEPTSGATPGTPRPATRRRRAP
jgi:transcriptional regulator with XRE-family HTH domain